MRILYSYNKNGYEAEKWRRDIEGASNETHQFIAFNHGTYADPNLYMDAHLLDRLYRAKDPGLMQMYAQLEKELKTHSIDALLVFNCPPYHPEFLRRVIVYKVLYSGDDPDSTYKRNIPYLHAYHHVFYLNPSYSADMDMHTKMRYCGMINADFVPYGVRSFEYNNAQTEDSLFVGERDIDILYVGSCFRQKLAILAQVKRFFGKRSKIHGYFTWRNNVYFIIKHKYRGWVRPLTFEDRLKLLQRTKIGFNIHWSNFGLGNERLYYLPANGVMQICDCPDYVGQIFKVGQEIDSYQSGDDLVRKLQHYLQHDDERQSIARAGYRRVMSDYRFGTVLQRAAGLIKEGMVRIGWRPAV